MNESQRAQQVLLAGFICLVLAIGLGRFAFTPIVPLLQTDLGVSDDLVAYLAAANYLGYFLGTFWLLWRHTQLPPLWSSVALLLISLAGMAVHSSIYLWLFWRFLAGFSGAWLYMSASTQVLIWLNLTHRLHWSGYLFAGVGAGIVLAGLSVSALETLQLPGLAHWQSAWLVLTIIGILLLLPLRYLNHPPPAPPPAGAAHMQAPAQAKTYLLWLTLAYFFEGLGYIISGTFLVSAVLRLPDFSGNASYVWVLVGLASMPACLFWSWVGKRSGLLLALLLAFALQTLGITLPVWGLGTWGVYAGALLFGGTFMGIVNLTMSFGKTLRPQHPQQVLSALTLAFSVGQIIGPLCVTWVDTLSAALLMATGFSALGGLSLLLGWSVVRRAAAE